MRKIFYFLHIFWYAIFIVSCSNQVERKEIIGNWRCDIDYPAIKGVKCISFNEDSTLSILDFLQYSIKEGEVNVSVKCNVSNSGIWSIDNGCLIFDLQEYVVEIDSTSLRILSDSPQIMVDTLGAAYGAFRKELLQQIKGQISASFPKGRVGHKEIGKPRITSPTVLILENQGNSIVLERCLI